MLVGDDNRVGGHEGFHNPQAICANGRTGLGDFNNGVAETLHNLCFGGANGKKLFITARNLNLYSGDLDSGSSAAVTALETFKKTPAAQDVFSEGYFGDASVVPGANRSQAVLRFDADWNTLPADDAGEAVFVMTAVLSRDVASGGLWDMSVRIEITERYRVESRRGDELVSLAASRFDAAGEGAP
jgi:hypothetical protein